VTDSGVTDSGVTDYSRAEAGIGPARRQAGEVAGWRRDVTDVLFLRG